MKTSVNEHTPARGSRVDAVAQAQPLSPDAPHKRESLFLNLLLNIVIPTLILTRLSGPDHLGPQMGIVVALVFPIGYGVRDYFRAHKINFFSALGVFSITLTGGMSLLELDPKYIAFKEAAIPGMFCLATLISLKTPFPIVRTFLYNSMVLDTDRVDAALAEKDSSEKFEKILVNASWMLAGSFLLSSILNYFLARYLLVSPPGSEAYNAELGRMTALSFPVIAVPATVIMICTLFYLFRNITRLTELEIDDIIQHH